MGRSAQPDPPTPAPAAGAVDTSDLLGNVLRDRSVAGRFGALEATLGVVVMSFLGFVIVVVGAVVIANAWIANYPRLGDAARVALTACWFPVAYFERRSFLYYLDALSHASHPLPVGVAVRQARRHGLARIAATLWWGGHAAAAVVLAHWFVGHVTFANPTAPERAIQLVAPLLVMFGAAFAMNTHLLIAAYALPRSARLVRWIWRARILLDLAVIFLVPTVHANVLNPA